MGQEKENGKLRVGLIGCGVMGRSLAEELVKLKRAQLVGVCDTVEKAARGVGEQFGVEAFTNPHEFVQQTRFEAVLIATPPFTHADLTVAAAKAGKHVFCEKPMAPHLEDCDAMIAACRDNGVRLMIGQVCRFHAIHCKVKEVVSSGEVGNPLCIVVYRIGGGFGGVWGVDWRKSRSLCGGALMEINSHELDFMRWVCGEVERVYAAGGNYVRKDWDYPDLVLITLHFRSGAVGLMHSSQASVMGGYGGRVDCEKGTLFFPSFWGENASLTIKPLDGEARVLSGKQLKVESPVRQELRDFVDAVLDNREPSVTGEDGRAAIEIALAAYQSVEEGQPVSLPLRI